jgi:anti-anti-sigma factor
MKLTLSIHTTAGSARVCVAGDLVYGSTDELVETVSRVLTERPGVPHLYLDFIDLAFCDSAGLSALLLVHRKTSASGTQLHLAHRPPQLDRLLDITGLLDYLTSCPDVESAGETAEPAGAPTETEIG